MAVSISQTAPPMVIDKPLLLGQNSLHGGGVGPPSFVEIGREDARMDPKSLEFLVEASKVLNSTLDERALLSMVYDLIVAAVDCEVCSLGRLAERGDTIQVLLAFGRSGPEVAGLTIEKGQGIMGRVVDTGKPLILNDPSQISEYQYQDALDRSFGFQKRSSLAVPLLRGGEVIGALEAINKEAGTFTSQDVEILSALSEQIAIALDNARLYGRITTEIKQRELLYEVGVRISSSLDLEEVMNLILQCLGQVVEYHAGGIFLVNPDTMEILRLTTRGYDPEMENRVGLKFGEGIVGWVAKNVKAVIVGDVSKDARYLNARPRTRSEIVVPLLVDQRIVGVINLESDQSDAFTEDDLDLINTFGSQAAISIERAKLHKEILDKRRLEAEVELARRIQRSFLPEVIPDIEGYDLSAINLPSEEVSGDYYDVIKVAEGQWGLVIADVFGKGIPASLVMASFRASLLAEIRNNYSIGTILSKVNRLIWESVEPERCVTACYGVLDAKAGILTYSNAGHLYPILVGKAGTRRLSKGGMLLGAVRDGTYKEERVRISTGDLLLFFTDGLTEAENRYGAPFGEDRLLEAARSLIDRPCSDIVKGIHGVISEFTGANLADDFTVLAVKSR
jgi:sigma-B regulation protein RsbU (phosphoserine phosphatase)